MNSTFKMPLLQSNVVNTSLLYFIIASGWILVSDHLVSIFALSYNSSALQSYKGLFFVLFTSILLFLLLFRQERKQFIAKQKLMESESRYRKFVDQLSEIIFRIDLPVAIDNDISADKQMEILLKQGYITDYNEAFIHRLSDKQKSQSGSISLQELDFLLPERLLKQFVTSDYKIADYELKVHNPGGESKYLLYNMSGFRNHSLRLECIWVTINDISRMKSSEARLEMALEGAQLGIWDLHLPTGQAVYDERMAEMLGYELKELGSSLDIWQNLIFPEDLASLKQAMNGHLEGRSNEYSFEFRARSKNGSYKWILAVGKALEYDETGKPIRASGIHMDISKRKNAEKQLKDTNYFINSIVNNLQEGLVVYDADFQIILWNKKMEEITGYSADKLLKKNPMSYFPHLKKEGYDEYFAQATSGKICFSSDIYFTGAHGKSIWYNSIFSPYYSMEGKVLGIIEVLRDVTERKKQESMLAHHNKELQKTNQELDNFVYRVSHDLRAPITSSLGLARLSKSENDLNVLKQYAQMQEKSLVKLDKFIQDILDYSRNSRMEVNPVAIDFEQLIREVLQNHYRFAQEKEVNVILDIKQQAAIYSDELRLKIIFNNLISNALKFQNPYREDPIVKIAVESKTSHLRIVVEDNGMGIAEKHLDKLFQMFYRATDKQPGSGIGLYIVKDCLKKLNGDIKVESVLDKGTRFVVDIPNQPVAKTG